MSTLTHTASAATRASSGFFAQRSLRRRVGLGVSYALLTIGGLVALLPFLWLVSSSLKEANQIFVYPPQWLPQPPRWSNYTQVFSLVPVGLYARNTLTITILALIGTVCSATTSAYAFARLRWPGRDVCFALILSTLMLPYAVTLIPVFILFKDLHWLDTFLPLIVPAWFGGGAFNIFLLRQFLLTIPMELEEAARIDGANSWTILARIVVPLARPAIAVVAIFSFQYHWNDFLGPLIFLTSDDKWTLAIGLNALQGLQWGRDTTNLIMAMTVMMVAPIVVLYLLAQPTFIQGIVLTGLKA